MNYDPSMIYKLDGKPPLKVAIPLGMQHVLAMFIGNIAPIIVLAGIMGDAISPDQKTMMIQCAMLVAGLVTLIQLYPIGPVGAKLPIVVGTSFAFMGSAISIGKQYGMPGLIGASLVGSLGAILMGIFIRPLRKFFPPLVTGVVLIAIGLNLMPVGIKYFAGGQAALDAQTAAVSQAKAAVAVELAKTPEVENKGQIAAAEKKAVEEALHKLNTATPSKTAPFAGPKSFGSVQNISLGFLVLTCIVLLQRFTKGTINLSAVLISLIIGYLAAIPMGLVNFGAVASAGLVSLPSPFAFGAPEFHLDAIIKFAAVYMVVSIETIGNISGITLAGENREGTEKEFSGAILADGIGSALAAIFNILPNTAYGQNAGIVAMTKVMNRFCVATGAIFLIIAGIFPKFGAICAVMPSSVLGGAVVMIFAMITISGIKMVVRGGLGSRNTAILAIALGLGIGSSMVKEAFEQLPYVLKFIMEDAVIFSSLIAIVLNIVFPKEDQEDGKEAAADFH